MFAHRWLSNLACGVALTAAGCNTGPSPLVSEVLLTPATVAPGGAFEIRIIVRNVGDEALTFVGSSSCRLGFEILRNDEIVEFGPKICTDDLARYTLEPGEGFGGPLPTTAVDVDGNQLAPGSYVVRAVAQVAEPAVYVAEGPGATLVVQAAAPQEAQ